MQSLLKQDQLRQNKMHVKQLQYVNPSLSVLRVPGIKSERGSIFGL